MKKRVLLIGGFDKTKSLAASLIKKRYNVTAINSDMPDYEDALLAYRGKRANVNHIVTRNVKDFTTSPMPAITPADFLSKYFS